MDIPPLLPGDAYDQALRLASAQDRELAALSSAPDQSACLARQWREVVTLGWPLTLVPEELGGAGGGFADLAALAEGAGRAGCAMPLAACCAVVPALLGAAGIAAGERDICPVLAPLRFEGGRLHGSASGVEGPPAPTHLLAVCDNALLLLPAEGLTPHLRIDCRPSFDIVVDAVPEVLLRGEAVRVVADRARDLGALVTCIEAASAMAALIEQTVAYLSARSQFGATLSTFQALRHKAVEMYVATSNLRALLTPLLSQDRPDPRHVALTKIRTGEVGRFVAQTAIQLHGGMGMTEELPAIRLARRILMAEFEYGDRAFHAARLLSHA